MTGYKVWTSCVGSDRSTNRATTSAPEKVIFRHFNVSSSETLVFER